MMPNASRMAPTLMLVPRIVVKRIVVKLAFGLHLTLAALMVTGPAAAHSPLASLSPADGAAVAAPPAIEMEFRGLSKLVRFDLTHVDEESVVELGRSHLLVDGTSHVIKLPDLPPGEYEAKWRAMAVDGHVMKGGFAFTILAN